MSDDALHFVVRNSKRLGPKDHSHGIGIHYLQSQLAFAYQDDFHMEIEDEKLFYTTSLTIELKVLQPDYLPLNTTA
jgi:hypothetical protein